MDFPERNIMLIPAHLVPHIEPETLDSLSDNHIVVLTDGNGGVMEEDKEIDPSEEMEIID